MAKKHRAKHKSFKTVGLALGGFAIAFLLGTLTILPIFQNKQDPLIVDDRLAELVDTPFIVGDDPFNNTDDLGWELLENDTIIHAWNTRDSYYFNNSNGVQFSNHYEEYWTHNVLMVGYYSGGEWNLIYRVDELSDFNRLFEGETDSFMNLTLWKDLSYGAYDFRLALQYHLKPGDYNLTVTPYIKNLGIAIPFDIGFGWEMKDIKIANTEVNDQFRLDDNQTATSCTVFDLDNPGLDQSSSNLTFWYMPVIENETQNWTWRPNTIFYLDNKNLDGMPNQTLYLEWDYNLNYKLQVKARAGQYNAPVTLFINAGTLGVGQEKQTSMKWYDDDITYGTPVAFDTDINRFTKIAKVNTNKFAVAYMDNQVGVVEIGTVTGTSISFGSAYIFDSDVYVGSYSSIDICEVTTDTFVVVYSDDSLGDDGYAKVGECIGTTVITYGAAYEFETGDTEFAACAKVDTNKFIVCYNDESASDTGQGRVCTVSNRVITGGAINDFAVTDYYPQNMRVEQITTDKFVVAFEAGSDSTYDIIAFVGTSSGTTITWGSAYTVYNYADTDNIHSLGIAVFDSTYIAFVYASTDVTESESLLRYRVASVSGTSLTFGDEETIDTYAAANKFAPIGVKAIDTERCVLAFENPDDPFDGYSSLGTLNDAEKTITWGTYEEYESGVIAAASIYSQDIAEVSNNKIVIVYSDNGVGNAVAGDVTEAETPVAPVLSDEAPTNGSTNIDVTPDLYVMCTDGNDHTMSATWLSNSSGEWLQFASNSSIANNTNITQNNINFTEYNTKYWWRVILSDAFDTTNETYHFTTKDNILTSVDTIDPYETSTNPLTLTATSTNATPDDVTLWYRYSTDNTSWENTTLETNVYYFNNYSEDESWAKFQELMVDGDNTTYGYSKTDDLVQLCDGNSYSSVDKGNISWVNLRVHTYGQQAGDNLDIRPVFGGVTDGSDYFIDTGTVAGVNYTIDITNDSEAPDPWTWDDIGNLDVDVIVNNSGGSVFVSMIEIIVRGNSSGWQVWDDASNPDTGAPWSWSFNFPNSTGYYEFYSIGVADGFDDELAPDTNDTLCHFTVDAETSWQTVDDTFNGVFTNTTVWQVIDDTFNGLFSNTTVWKIMDDTFNGVFANATSWKTVDDTFNGVWTNTTSWQVVDDTFNGVFSNSTSWQVVDDTFNGIFTNTTIWTIIDSAFNGIFINTTTWKTVDNTFNGVFSNTTIWATVDDTYDGIFTNITYWVIIDDTYNGVFTNATSWQTVDDTFNGVFTNTTVWQVIDDTFNGLFSNTTSWKTVDNTYNGIFANSTVWQIIDDTYNGIFTNSTFWTTIDDTFNGVFNNITSWQVVDDTFNGMFTNSTVWQTLDDAFNGVFSNTTDWNVVDSSFNGVFTNSTVWQTLDDAFNGVFTNSTTWIVIDSTYNGVFTNTSYWNIIDDTFNGIFINTTFWTIVDNTYNGIFTNATFWQVVDDAYNGIFTNASSWKTVDNTYNGIFANSTVWQIIDDTYNGIFTNSTFWTTIDDTFNGVFNNITSWQVVDDTFNGMFSNASSWKTVDNTFNGIFTNSTTWIVIDSTYNGIFTNSTVWQTIDDTYNGIFANSTIWQIIDNTFNGLFTNASSWKTVDNTYNGIFANSTYWNIIDDAFNGIFTNISYWITIDDTYNGIFSNTTSWNIIDSSFNGIFTNTTVWFTVDSTFNGVFSNTTGWVNVDSSFNGVFTNASSWKTVDNTFNGIFTNATVVYITISNIYPANNSINIPKQPTMYLTIEQINGEQMDVSWYIGTSANTTTTLLGTDNNIFNSTIYKQYIQATSNSTTYYWRINATDGNNTVEYIYNFATERGISMIITGQGGGVNLIIYGMLGLLGLFGVIGLLKKRRRPPYKVVYRRRNY